MSELLGDVFADTVYWLALVVRQDAYHVRAHAWTERVTGRIITTTGVLIETANALAPPPQRRHAVRLVERLRQNAGVEILDLDKDLVDRGWHLYCDRPDKSWSWVDCISFVLMQDRGLTVALTADHHFEQAGYRAVLLEEPS